MKGKHFLDQDKIQAGVRLILEGMRCDLEDRNFRDTPARVARLMEEMFAPPATRFPVFTECYNGVVVIKRHTAFTLCPHHMLPLRMHISMAYAPAGRVVGLSKLPRMVQDLNRRPMLQEELTTRLVERLAAIPKNRGAAVYIDGDHACMQIRGVRSTASTVTSAARGIFEEPLQWANFLKMIQGGGV